MQRDINNRNTFGDILNPIDNARRSTVIDKTTSNYNDAKEKGRDLKIKWENTMLTLQNIFLD